MRSSNCRKFTSRIRSFEAVEPRMMMTAQPLGDFWLDYASLSGAGEYSSAASAGDVGMSLAEAHYLSGLTTALASYGFTGQGQTVAVIDSGIAYDHVALGGGLGANYRVVGGWDFTEENDANPYDDGLYGSHGTHVAGIIGANDGTNRGVASGVDLVALRVFNDSGAGYFSWVESALRWVHQNRNSFENPITAVNLSLGTNWNSTSLPAWATLEDEFAQLEADGIFISVAAGNGFTTYNTPGLSYPAASSYVVPVSSVDDNGSLSSFSQRHSRAIAAPGRNIRSTVPDYVGNLNGRTDDWASYSGTSMAAPYVAGASVLLREAMQFAGWTNITQDAIYDVMRQTADTIYDAITNQNYLRLNLGRALDSVMPQDEFGSTVATAHSLGTISSGTSVNGAIAKLNDKDFFTFTAGRTGTASFTINATGEMAAHWEIVGATGTVSGVHGQTLTFQVTAGQSYTIGVSSGDGLGRYTLGGQITGEMLNWGQVEFEYVNNVGVAGDTWFAINTTRAGALTVEAFFANAAGNVNLEVYNSAMQRVGSSATTANFERVDVTASAAGETFYVRVIGTNSDIDFRLTNLVARNGSTVTVFGTGGDDVFTFTAGKTRTLNINGVQYQFATANLNNLTFHGGAGDDTVTLTGSTGKDYAFAQAGTAQVYGVGYQVAVTESEVVRLHGGGGADEVKLWGTSGNDSFISRNKQASLTGDNYFNEIFNFAKITAFGEGGNDSAVLYDSKGNDLFVGAPGQSTLSGSGYFNQLNGFANVEVVGSTGTDTARLYDSAGNDTFEGRHNVSTMQGSGLLLKVWGFDKIYASANSGGNDVALLFDSPGIDVFKSYPTYSTLQGSGYLLQATGFDTVDASAILGGVDRAYFYDSAGNDTFSGYSTHSILQGPGFINIVRGFENVYANGSKGFDVAHLFDSAGNDVFSGHPTLSSMRGAGYYNEVRGFDSVAAMAYNGGADQTNLNSARAQSLLTARTDWARLLDANVALLAQGFDDVSAYATDGGVNKRIIDAVDFVLAQIDSWKA